MSKGFYFKITFFVVSASLFVGLFVYGLFDVDFSNSKELSKLFIKSLFTGVVTGLVLGVINMYLKIGNFPKKDNI